MQFGNIATARKVVAAAGTPERLAAAGTRSGHLFITALKSNTGRIGIGGSTIDAADGAENGLMLEPGERVELFMEDIGQLYVDAEVSGDGVSYASFS